MRKRHGESVFSAEYEGPIPRSQPKDNTDMRSEMRKKHSDIAGIPPMKRIGAKRNQSERGLPAEAKRNMSLREEMKLPKKRAMGGAAKDSSERRAAGGSSDHWIQGAIKKPGSLHKTLGIPQGTKIPRARLIKAEHSPSPLTRKRATLAMTLKGLRHK